MDIIILLRQLRFLNAAVKQVIPQEKFTQLQMETERTPLEMPSTSEAQTRTVHDPLSDFTNISRLEMASSANVLPDNSFDHNQG